jgi:hypothetical protein
LLHGKTPIFRACRVYMEADRIGQSIHASCPFCSLDPNRKWINNEHALAFPDVYPVTDGHTLVIPCKHVSSIYE